MNTAELRLVRTKITHGCVAICVPDSYPADVVSIMSGYGHKLNYNTLACLYLCREILRSAESKTSSKYVEMADEAGMGHAGLQLVISDRPHPRLVHELEALIGAHLSRPPRIVLLLMTVPAHDGPSASRGVAGCHKCSTILCAFSSRLDAIGVERDTK